MVCEVDGTGCKLKTFTACNTRGADCIYTPSPNSGKVCVKYSTGCVEIKEGYLCSDITDTTKCT